MSTCPDGRDEAVPRLKAKVLDNPLTVVGKQTEIPILVRVVELSVAVIDLASGSTRRETECQPSPCTVLYVCVYIYIYICPARREAHQLAPPSDTD